MTGIEFTDDYYDLNWSNVGSPSPQEEERIRQTISLVPEDCTSLLDIGCGDGRITNRLLSKYKQVVGLERSREALRHVKAEKILGSADYLPFPEQSFDLVLCCELLEHLPFKVYPKAIEEIERVATKYIVVTVPNNEDIKRQFVICPHCGCSFHVWRHLRSFSQESLTNLFNICKVEIIRVYRPLITVYPLLATMEGVARFCKLVTARSFPTGAVCPQCGYSSVHEASPANSAKERSRFSFLIHLAKKFTIEKESRGWLMALYQRNF